MKRWMPSFAVLLIVAVLGALYWRYSQPLPYVDGFAEGRAGEWSPMGGLWFLKGDEVVNQSDEWGAKLVTGSPRWSDYSLDADVQMVGHGGGAGLLGRVSDAEPGTDAYSGYLIGLRSNDGAMVLGRADHGWIEARPVAMPGGVQPDTWFHLHVVFFGCTVAAEAKNLTTGQQAWTSAAESHCPTSGLVGLRSSGTGGAWRHIRVSRATNTDLMSILVHAPRIETYSFPLREDSNYRMRMELAEVRRPAAVASRPAGPKKSVTNDVDSIRSLRQNVLVAQTVRTRGIVTLTNPLFIQDDTGGIELKPQPQVPPNLGDEVEVVGHLQGHGTELFLDVGELALRRERSLTIPVSVTSTQAAEGTFNDRLVDLHGRLRSKSLDGNLAELNLSDAEQTFHAVLPLGLSHTAYDKLHVGSELRLRGVCAPQVTSRSNGSFSLLLRSTDDVEVLAEPPWWSPHYLVRYVLLFVMFVGLAATLYIRNSRQRLKVALDERQRLANELHDSLAQNLAGVGFHLQGIRNTLRSESIDRTAVAERVDLAYRLVARSHREASAEIAALHLDADSGEDLLTALERSARAMLGGEDSPIQLLREGQPKPMSLLIQDALFQVGREAIGNALRHAHAGKIRVTLAYGHRLATLTVADDGSGFVLDDADKGLGLMAMRERMLRIAGTFTVQTQPGLGTSVTVTAPVWVWKDWRMRLSTRIRRRLARAFQRAADSTPDRS